MGAKTGIEWTDSTWNPLRGCSRVSEGCRNCYAEHVAYRFSGPGQAFEGLAVLKNDHASWTGRIDLVEKHLLDPLRWRAVKQATDDSGQRAERPRRIFVNSVSDLFHENVPDQWIDKIFAVMALSPQHIFQVLTKRPKRMLEYLTEYPERREETCWRWHVAQSIDEMFPERTHASIDAKVRATEGDRLPNVWLGVSVENQSTADERIPLLLRTPAAVRFISAEPLLGPVDLEDLSRIDGEGNEWRFGCLGSDGLPSEDDPDFRGAKLDWAICGGESGPNARPMHPDWARSLRDQCKDAGVPFFFKQWGEWAEVGGGPPHREHIVDRSCSAPIDHANCILAVDGHCPGSESEMKDGVRYRWMSRVGKHAAGALLDGVEHRAFPADHCSLTIEPCTSAVRG